jgi:polyhydroxyalkanoate synthesis regulator phasin
MNNTSPFNLVQKSFRVSIGAVADLIETIQDNRKRQDVFNDLQQQLKERATQLEQKGEVTEQEARANLEKIWQKASGNKPASEATVDTTATTSEPTSESMQENLKDLTDKIIELREELAALKKEKGID